MGFKTRPVSNVRAAVDWLKQHTPSLHASLAAPATASELAALSRVVGDLPPDFAEFYLLHNGQSREDIDFVPYYYLLDLENIHGIWADMQTYESIAWRPEWLPFARFDCDYLCINTKRGTPHAGEVFACYLKFPERDVIANSFLDFLQTMRSWIEQKRFTLGDEGLLPDPEAKLSWIAEWAKAR